MDARWPDASAAPDADLLAATDLPDANDVHVLASAVAAGADLLVTYNLRDFPAGKLRALGVSPLGPDAFLWEAAGRAPQALSRTLAAAAAPFAALSDPQDLARAVKRAHLPRLAKMIRQGALAPEGPDASR